MTERTFQDMITEAKQAGGKVHCPNGLPIKCIRHDGLMLEIEHGDHPTYMFPVDVEYTGEINENMRKDWKMLSGEELDGTDEQVRDMQGEYHALIYTDGGVALTLYEGNYAMFSIRTGEALDGRYVLNIKSIAIPALGCGLGGLNWDEVRKIIEKGFATLPHVEVLLFAPG